METKFIEELNDKIAFVKRLNEAIVGTNGIPVVDLTYHVFKNRYGSLEEYLLITYRGGAHAARNCCGDSEAAIFDEVNHYLISGAPREYFDGYAAYEYYLDMLIDSEPVEGILTR